MSLSVEKEWTDKKGKKHITSGAPEWKSLNGSNSICPGCKNQMYSHNTNIEYSKTKRGTHIFWHTECTGKVWH